MIHFRFQAWPASVCRCSSVRCKSSLYCAVQFTNVSMLQVSCGSRNAPTSFCWISQIIRQRYARALSGSGCRCRQIQISVQIAVNLAFCCRLLCRSFSLYSRAAELIVANQLPSCGSVRVQLDRELLFHQQFCTIILEIADRGRWSAVPLAENDFLLSLQYRG